MELPIGQIAEDLIREMEEEINVRRKEIEQFKGSIEGVKHFVFILKKRAESELKPATGAGESTAPATYRHPSVGTTPAAVATTQPQATGS